MGRRHLIRWAGGGRKVRRSSAGLFVTWRVCVKECTSGEQGGTQFAREKMDEIVFFFSFLFFGLSEI